MHNIAKYFLNTGVLISVFLAIFLSATIPNIVFAESNDVTANIIVENTPNSSVLGTIGNKLETSWPWYLTRASGLVAGILMFILILSGMGFITGHAFNFLEPITAWASHRALGIALGVALILHIGSLYFDTFVPFDFKELFIPFTSTYRPVEIFGLNIGSLYVALGIFALYLILAIIFTSLFWVDKKPKTWKLIHLLSYFAMVFVFFHALYLGTDLSSGVLRYVWIGLMLILGWAGIVRLKRVKTV